MSVRGIQTISVSILLEKNSNNMFCRPDGSTCTFCLNAVILIWILKFWNAVGVIHQTIVQSVYAWQRLPSLLKTDNESRRRAICSCDIDWLFVPDAGWKKHTCTRFHEIATSQSLGKMGFFFIWHLWNNFSPLGKHERAFILQNLAPLNLFNLVWSLWTLWERGFV